MTASAETMYKIYQKILKEALEDSKKDYVKRFNKNDYVRQINKTEMLICILQKHLWVLEARGDYDKVHEHGLIHLDTKIY